MILSPECGGYSVFCPAMPGAVSQGDSRDEALANIIEAMEGWMEVGAERDDPPLVETPELIADMIREVLEDRAEEELEPIVETASVQVRVVAVAA